ncbi:hypothetical protein LB504_001914 [Fusarium proliferatum]|nr:hypothetical protein LB504_001914 [Fusarium proliferatum]
MRMYTVSNRFIRPNFVLVKPEKWVILGDEVTKGRPTQDLKHHHRRTERVQGQDDEGTEPSLAKDVGDYLWSVNNLQYEDFSYMEQQASVRHMEPRRAKRCRWEVEALVEVRRWHRHSCAGV